MSELVRMGECVSHLMRMDGLVRMGESVGEDESEDR